VNFRSRWGGEILTWAENLERANLSPIEEARACERAVKKAGLFPAQIAKQIHRSIDWVEERLALLSIPAALQDLVHTRQLPMRHANELARVTDDAHREHLTRYALMSGASFSVIKDWVGQWRLHAENPAYAPLALPPLPVDGERAIVLIPCMTCGDAKPPHELRVKHICVDC
jgi:ParB family chromosome partitioning protein